MSEELNNTSFAEMIENSMKQINIKQVVKGTVVNINRKGEIESLDKQHINKCINLAFENVRK